MGPDFDSRDELLKQGRNVRGANTFLQGEVKSKQVNVE